MRSKHLTRYLTFKPDKDTAYLVPHVRNVFEGIAKSQCVEPEGITFEDLLARVSYKGQYMGPKLLRASLKTLFERDYIITNHQIANLSEKLNVDVNRVRGYRRA